MAEEKVKNPLTGLEIAVVGMSGRFPGAANIDEFWENLKNGKETISFFSDIEMEEAGVPPLQYKRANYIKAKGMVEDIEYFDASFFDYTPREARMMDPQLRLLHECAWEALENAGYAPRDYTGLIGFYAGASFNVNWLSRFSGECDATVRMEAGSLYYKDSLSTLIAYKLNLKGPSLTLYTACSTSLTAIHQACRGLLTGECHMALAGGVSVSVPKKSGYLYQPGMILSPDGHCRVFDAKAGGTVFGDGAGIVALKRLEDAIREGDHISAVIKASVINNDGLRKAGYAAPSVDGQEEAVRAALHMAEIDPESITFIEAHGSGTGVGDPIEMEALMRVFKSGKERYCAVGSVKTNVGHLDVASGVAGFIKTVLALTHRLIPPTLHFKTPNPEIDFQNSAFYVNTEPLTWESREYPLRAGINSTGIGGGNAHAILEEAPISVSSEISRSHHLLVLSAVSDPAADRAVTALAAYLKKHPEINLADAAYTLNVGRHAFGKRRAVVCGDIKDAVEILEQRKQHFFFSGEHIDRSVIFMFPGQGTQYAHMAWELYKDEPVFRRYLDMCAEMIEALSGIDLIEAIYPRRLRKRNGTRSETGDKDILTAETHIGQLALFAVEYALAQLWMSWGVRPRGMIGHSVGEYTAACLAGVFTLENALRVIIARGLLTQQIPEGRMVAVVMGEKKVRSFLGNNLWLAAINTPSLCVVSGTISAIHRLQGQLARRRIPCIPLKTMRAFHSGMLDAILAPFAKVMEQVPLNPPKIPFVSGVTGEWITADQAEDPGYWVKHLRQPVHFSNGVQELLREPNRILLEVGPGDTLKRLVKHHIQYEDRRRMFSSLRRGDEAESDTAFLLKTLGQVWVAGVLPDWVSFYGNENRRRIPLPTYPFERKRYWPDRKQELQKKDGPKKIPNESLLHHHPRPDLSAAFTPPSGEIEKVIAAVWEDLFEIRPIGRNDNFFELGGHSLNATILISRIHRELDVNIPLKEVFTHPTVDRLAAVVEKAGRDTHSAVEPVEKQNYYRLSSAQKRTYFLWQMDKGGTAYNMPVVRVVEGELDRGKCEKTFRTLIQRHESLRTSFHIVAGVPVQRVHRHAAFCIDYYHIELGEWGKKRAVSLPGRVNVPDTAKMIVDFIRPFDLSRVPLLRVGLVRLSRHRHLLLFDMHHIISDGTSMNIFVKDYMSIYGGETLAPLQLQYKDFAHWQWINKEKDSAKKQEAYWKKEFEGEVPILNLPVDYVRVRSAVRSVEGGSSDFEIGKPGTRGISKLAAAEGATLFMILLSFFNVLLAKLSGQEDIVVGSPIAGRRHVDIEHIIGMFVNTLAMRSYPAPGKSFKDFLGEVRERVLQDFENQDYQFEDLVEEAGGSLDRSRNPLFDVMFVLQNTGIPEMEVSGLKLKPFHFKSRTSKFDILLSVVEMGGLLHFRMQYRTRLFKEESIQRFIKYFKKIVTAVIRQPEIEISQIEIISEEEKQQVLHHFNRSEADYPRDKTLHRLFSEQAAKTPDSIAVTGKGRLYLTYGELDAKADGVAGILKGKGIKEDRITAIIMNRSGEMIIGMLAILKAGAAYLPIDPEFPRARVKFILEDSRAAAVLMQRHLYEATGTELRHFFAGDILPLETGVSGTGKTISPISRQDTCKPGNPAYVIYTSGTTGRPKGVAVEHRSAVNVVSWFGKECRLGSGVNVLQLSDYTFDASVNQVFGSLLRGAVLHVVDKRLILYMDKLRHYIDTHLAHIVYYVPMVLNRLLCYGPKLKSLHTVISGGERLNDITKDKILEKGYILYNHYGPTETAVDALASRCSPVKVTLGTPVSNARCYILDTGGKPVPVGVAGELYIAGVGVSRGYLNSPHLTAEKFVNLDFLPDERLYRSGDLVRWLPDGNVEFLGRIDQQVKIRGCRIELGEIRTQLLAVGFIKEAVVVEGEFSGGGEYGEDAGEKYLCAYIVSDSAVNPNELKNRLSNRLPSYMLPAYFVQVDRIPLTAVGKLDRKALPEPEAGFVDRYTPPEGELEEELAAVWADVLGRKKEIIGRETNFFELGGHSLKATLLLSRIHESFGVRLPLEKIFSSPTVKALARNIRGTSGEEYSAVEPVEEESYYALSSAQKRLYVLQEMDETATAYNMLTVLVLVGMLDREKLEGCFIKLIRRHESLRTSFEFVKNSPVQRVHRCPAFEIEYHDGSGAVVVPDRRDQPDLLDTVGSFLEVEKIIEDFVRPFDLSAAPLLRAGLIRMEEKRHMLMVDMHHIISDGISVKRFVTEFMIFYAGGEPAPLKLQYKDYAGWQTHLCLRRPEASRKQEEFWKKQFADEIPILHLPTDYRRPKLHDFEGGQKHFQVSREQTRALKNLALEEGATIFMVLLAVSYIFLSRISGQEDIVIGTPTAGRNHADLQDIIGMFVNTLAVRGLPSGRTIVKQFLGDIRKRTLDVFENQDYHFEDLVDRLSVTRDVGRNPLFDVMFSLEHLEIPEIELPQLKLVPYPFERGISLFDLSIVAREKDGRLWFIFEYNTKLFKQETIHRFSGYFKQLLAVLPHSREKRIRHLELMAPEERKQVLFRFNDTWSPWLPWSSCSETRTVRELFEEQAARIPDYIAVVDMAAGGLFNHFTYGQLNRVSDQLTLTMRKKGIKEGDIVGIMGKRSLEMTAGIFGILKAGAAYMPIDPDFPIGRKQFMLSDSCSKVLVTSRDLAEEAEELTERMGKGEIIFTDARSRRFQVPRLIRQGSSSPAYVIYTSGSTGKPKGVIVEHHSVMNRLYWIQQKYRLDDRDVVVQKTPFIFDVSVCELFRYIPGGGRAVLVPETGDKDPEILVRLIEMSNATTIDFVPSILDIFLDHIRNRDIAPGAATLRWVFVGVEIVRPELVRKFNETLYASNGTQLINAYGPTETTVDVTAFNCSLDEQAGTVVPIGTPMGNIQVYILDKYGNVQPIGVVGELCIGGDGVSRGYLNNPGLTAEKFVDFSLEARHLTFTTTLYRSGDLARRLPDGNIEFIGRIDRQVKIRGFRIELGEIESRLLTHDGVREVVVSAKEDTGGGKYLCAYIVPVVGAKGAESAAAEQLKEHLGRFLPYYMIPARFVPLEKIPLTAAGKIDHRALPEPAPLAVTGDRDIPGTEEERVLTEVWSEVLALPDRRRPGLGANFFELGGDSIKAIQVAARLRGRGYTLNTADLFLNPFIRELAACIRPPGSTDRRPRPEPGAVERVERVVGEVPLTPIQHWFFRCNFTDSFHYNQAVMLYREEGFDAVVLRKAAVGIAAHHDALRMVFKGETHITQLYKDISGYEPALDIHDLREELDFEAVIREKSTGIQQGFDLEQGPLVKMGLFRTPGGDHLLIAIHHLVVDGVSWRILLEDFAAAYRQARQVEEGEKITLPPKTHSYKEWAVQLNRYARGVDILKEREYWKAVEETETGLLPSHREPAPGNRASRAVGIVKLSEEKTGQLLQEVHQAYTTGINDILLTALALALNRWGGMETILVNLEGHGRESIIEGMDTSRTVGWYTSQFPVVLRITKPDDPAYCIKEVKETLRRIPNKGIGYGILKYLTPGEKKKGISFNREPEIAFNYFGQLDPGAGTGGVFTISTVSPGDSVSPRLERDSLLDINGWIAGGQLTLEVSFNKKNIEGFTGALQGSLEDIILHCVSKEKRELTPHDLTYSNLTIDELDEIKRKIGEAL